MKLLMSFFMHTIYNNIHIHIHSMIYKYDIYIYIYIYTYSIINEYLNIFSWLCIISFIIMKPR